MLNLQQFEDSLSSNHPPENLSPYLQALWYDAEGNWDKAHSLVDDLQDSEASLVHAYLHRVEGDDSNAHYWYNRAKTTMPDISLKEEWKQLVQRFLAHG